MRKRWSKKEEPPSPVPAAAREVQRQAHDLQRILMEIKCANEMRAREKKRA